MLATPLIAASPAPVVDRGPEGPGLGGHVADSITQQPEACLRPEGLGTRHMPTLVYTSVHWSTEPVVVPGWCGLSTYSVQGPTSWHSELRAGATGASVFHECQKAERRQLCSPAPRSEEASS